MAKPKSGVPDETRSGTPPLSASDTEPAKANTGLDSRSSTSDLLVDAFWPSSSESSTSLRPQTPPAALTASNRAATPSRPWVKLPCKGPLMPLTFPTRIELAVMPGADAVFPDEPGQAAASVEGLKSKPDDGATTGLAPAAVAVAPVPVRADDPAADWPAAAAAAAEVVEVTPA